MKNFKNVLYIVDNYIYLKIIKDSKIYKSKLEKNILKHGKIANIKGFIKSFNLFLNNNNLNNYIFGESITVIHNPEYSKSDIDVLKSVLENFNYRKITFINEIKLYKLNNKNAYINYNEEYIILSYIDSYKQKKVLLLDNMLNIDEIVSIFKKRLKKKDILVFGRNKNIETLISKFKNNNCYHFNNDEMFLLDTL